MVDGGGRGRGRELVVQFSDLVGIFGRRVSLARLG